MVRKTIDLADYKCGEHLLYNINNPEQVTFWDKIANLADLSPIQENMLTWDTIGACFSACNDHHDCKKGPIKFFRHGGVMTVRHYHESNIVDMVEYGHNLLRLFQGRDVSSSLETVEFKNCPEEIADCKVYIIGRTLQGEDLYWLITKSGDTVREYAIGTVDSLFVKK